MWTTSISKAAARSSAGVLARRNVSREAGLVVYFRSLTDARPMGRGKFEVSVLQWQPNINDHDSAWNDTFVHPDSAHWLFEGSGLSFPGLTVRAGVSDKTDVGVCFTRNPNANYGFVGGQVQRNLVGGSTGHATAAVPRPHARRVAGSVRSRATTRTSGSSRETQA